MTGALCNDATQRFVAGAEMTLLEHDTDGTLLSQRVVTTDEQGKFYFDGVGGGNHELRGGKGEFQWSGVISVTPGRDLVMESPDCRLPVGVVTGRVCNHEDGEWIAGATISVATPNGTLLGTPTDESGAFTIDNVPSGKREVVAERNGKRIVVPVTVMGDATTDIGVTECVQSGRANVEGRICANAPGIWLSGATVRVTAGGETYTAVTDSDGKFRMRGLPAGTYTFAVAKGVYATRFEATTEESKTTLLAAPVCTPPDVPVAVVSGDYDRVQRVMSQLQFSNVTIYKGYDGHEVGKDLAYQQDGSWSALLLDGAAPQIFNYRIAMFNGGLSLEDLGPDGSDQRARRLAKLREYVQGGGAIYVSDYAYALLSGVFGAPVSFAATTAPIQQVNASVLDTTLAEKLGAPFIAINFPRSDWRLVEDLTAEVKTYLRGDVTTYAGRRGGVPLIVSFPFGQGRGVYTSVPSDRQPSAKFNGVIDHVIFDL